MLHIRTPRRVRAVWGLGVGVLTLTQVQSMNRVGRSSWTKNWLLQREQFRHMPLLRENNPDDFRNFLTMTDPVGIPEDVVKRCAVQISNALQFIVEKGLVHLDVKPDNVLVFDQECHSIKLSDFGLAKVTGTVIRSKCGSKPYRAPEMYGIAPPDGLAVDGSLDVWAFGVTIYVLLMGCFHGMLEIVLI
ncbi:hypothetical protein AB205_0009350 [Aquarana catesbeiana]|uniref:Protein kinase domain-containing protein n=1 Tax=Aquarana catesbeiana TaxID=8400 RepID=A0A2G9S073_AQUCT|nr:hypothetical protein AB205_0009350 [Aquarana catesbeiana]